MTDYPMQCGHILTFEVPPRYGDEMWCIRCDAPTRALRTARGNKNVRSARKHAPDFKSYCRDCLATRYHSRARDDESDERFAKRAGNYVIRHAEKHDHTVELWLPGEGADRKLAFVASREVAGQLPLPL